MRHVQLKQLLFDFELVAMFVKHKTFGVFVTDSQNVCLAFQTHKMFVKRFSCK